MENRDRTAPRSTSRGGPIAAILSDSVLGRRRFLGTAMKLAMAPALAQALAMGSVGRALAQEPQERAA